MNRMEFIGRLGKEIELKKTVNGKSAIDFSLAETEKFSDTEITTWLNCKAYGKYADNLSRYVRKGDVVYVAGKYRSEKYTAKDGSTRYSNYMLVCEFELLPNKREAKETIDDLQMIEEAPTVDDLHDLEINEPWY